MKGWIKLHRKLLDNPVASRAETLGVWVFLLLKASHEPTEFLHGNEVIKLKAGEFLSSQYSIAEQMKISRTKIQRLLKLFEKERMIDQQTSARYTRIIICNWRSYQQSDPLPGYKRATGDPLPGTFKNVKNVKNVKKKNVQFEKFWSLYPRKQKKKKSEEIFTKLVKKEKVNPDDIIKGVQKYNSKWKDTETKFIPLPTSWLNDQRWEDEIEVRNSQGVNVDDIPKEYREEFENYLKAQDVSRARKLLKRLKLDHLKL